MTPPDGEALFYVAERMRGLNASGARICWNQGSKRRRFGNNT
jgi:hypothetical protein